MSFEPEPGQSLEQQAGALNDPSVPERAGAIVTEVITSIADETRARADALRATAETDAKAEVDAARDASGRVVRCLDDLAGKLGELRTGIQQEEGVLSNSLGQLGSGPVPPALQPPPPAAHREGERSALVVDAEVVEDEGPEEAPVATEPHGDAGDAPPDDAAAQTVVLQPDENITSELGRMSDADLGHTYVEALLLAHEREQAGMDVGQAHAMLEAVLNEARGRPAFAQTATAPRGLRARVAAVTGRRATNPEERLREAIREGQPGA